MKETFCTAVGCLGAGISWILGGWSAAMGTLALFMIVDYIMGLITAGVFHKSPKSKNGALDSRAGFRGLCKKAVMLMFVAVANRLDVIMGTVFIKDAVIIGFITNELISIGENAGLIGIPMPKGIEKAIDILKGKGEENGD